MNKRVKWGIAALFGAVAIAGALVVRDALALETAFEASKKELKAVQTHLTSADLDAARAAAAAATEHAQATARHSDGPLWAVLSVAPYTRGSVTTLRAASELAAASADAAVAVSDGGNTLFNDDGTLRVEIANGQVDLGVLDEAGQVLDEIPVDRLSTAIEALEATGEGWWVPGRVAQEREGALELSSKVLEDLETARLATDALPGWLGADGPRRYLLAFQNPSELRGTGGFLGFLGVLEVDNGKFALGDSLDFDPTSPEADDSGLIHRGALEGMTAFEDLVDAPDDFAARYDPMAGRSFFGSVNLDPDFPTVAPVMLDLWKARTGQNLDGVITADPVLLREILKVTGPLAVPENVQAPGLPKVIRPNQVIQTLLVDAYDVLGGRSQERKQFHQVIAREAFATMFGGGWKPRPMLDALARGGASHHLQIYSADDDEQRLWQRIDTAGAFAPDDAARTDFLGLSFVNSAGNKSDVHVEHGLDVDYEVLEVDTTAMTAFRRVTATVTLDNRLTPDGHDRYIIGSYFPQELGTRRERDPRVALNRTWLTIWGPGGSLLSSSASSAGTAGVAVQSMHGLTTYDAVLETESRSQSSVTISFVGWVPMTGTPDAPGISLQWHPATTATLFAGRLTWSGPGMPVRGEWESDLIAGPDALLRLDLHRMP